MLRFLKRAGFDVILFLLFLHPQKPLNRPNSRSAIIFDYSLHNT